MFNLNEDYQDEFSVLKPDYYPVQVKSAEWKMSKTGTEYLNIAYTVVGPNHNGRYIWDMLFLLHEKQKVKNMALANLKNLIIACGYSTETLTNVNKEDIIELIAGKELKVKVKIESDEQYGDKNRVIGYSKFTKIEEDVFGADIPF
jgi:hypothetical protein